MFVSFFCKMTVKKFFTFYHNITGIKVSRGKPLETTTLACGESLNPNRFAVMS